MDITLITRNHRKVRSAQVVLGRFGVKVLQQELDVPEIQDSDINKVAEYSVKFAAEELKKTVIKVDVGFEISVLNGFPGPFSRFINEWLSPEKILKLLENESNRKAKFIDVVAYCKPGEKPVSFKAETTGVISSKPLGENGWGIDKIFIPDGFQTTLATLSGEERLKVWNSKHWNERACFLVG